jgi:DNA-binding MarR family transcriptional regulator
VQDERRVLIRLTATGRKLKARAARIPGCVLQATQCDLSEVLNLTRQVQALRDRLTA